MLFKACPRCRGDLYVERFRGGEERVCLQCGRTLSAAEPARLRASATQQEGQERQQPAVAAGGVA